VPGKEHALETIITIGGADKAGALARILGLLARNGYALKGQQIVESAGGRLLKIRLDLAQLDKDKLSAEIKSLNPDYEIIAVGFEGDDKAGAKGAGKAQPQAGSALIKEMAGKFPDIAALVQAYGGSFSAETRDQGLLEAGKKIGSYHYSKEWSFGNPLKMPAALYRALVPALEKFGAVEASDTDVKLPASPFCGTGGKKLNCCEFVTGFMQGFLDAGPSTKGIRVQKVSCRAKGSLHCAYTIDAQA
jgi:predicted hydrocarbon binding protein/predicted amino acid-binding ACT domain protein